MQRRPLNLDRRARVCAVRICGSEEAGRARHMLAAASVERRERSERALADANAAILARRKGVGTRTDDDIDECASPNFHLPLANSSISNCSVHTHMMSLYCSVVHPILSPTQPVKSTC
jgi:hypothetical protein